MSEARQLIEAKEYEKAVAILRNIDHPQAQKWLKKLNDIILTEKRNTGKALNRNLNESSLPVSTSKLPGDVTYSIVCPKCDQQSMQQIASQRVIHEFSCPSCQARYSTRFYQIRASRSRGFDSYRRNYTVRVVTPSGAEEALTFSTQRDLQMELRSKDLAAFTYYVGKLAVVQNLTIGTYWRITEESLLAWIALIIVIIIGVISYFASRVR